MIDLNRHVVVLAFICSFSFSNAGAVSLGQVDDFEDGSTMFWTAGGFNQVFGPQFPPNPPANVASGGPAGAGDNYLVVTAEAATQGPGSKLSTFNLDRTFAPTQWAGDYVAEAVSRITLDVNNFSAEQLDLRLLFLDPTFAFAAVSSAVVVAPGSGWVNVSFDVDVGSMVGLGGADAGEVMANAFVLRLMHAPVAGLANQQPAFAGQVGFDNISAVPVLPAIVLFLSGIAGLWARGRNSLMRN